MADKPEGHVVHVTPRRLRIRVPGKHRDALFFSDVRSELSARPGVDAVEVNPSTSSVLIHCTDSQAFLEMARRDAPFALAEELLDMAKLPLLAQIRQSLAEVNQQVQRLTGSRDDIRTYIFLVLVLGAAYRLYRGDIFAPAATLLWYAGEALRLWSFADAAQADASNGAGTMKEEGDMPAALAQRAGE